MQATKAAIAFQASATNTAGSTTTGTGVDLTTALDAMIIGVITNGGTGPTVACDFVVEVSNDNSVWDELVRATAPTTASTTFYFPVTLPDSVMYARSKFTGNTAQSVTVRADGFKLSSIA